MTNNVWLITGAGRGMGLDITKAALAADQKVVATGRNTDKVTQAVGESANLLVVQLDVTDPANAESAVKAAMDRFGRIDVLVNNAARRLRGLYKAIIIFYVLSRNLITLPVVRYSARTIFIRSSILRTREGRLELWWCSIPSPANHGFGGFAPPAKIGSNWPGSIFSENL
jgi:nucleoside-diphosphate-sugar epimerase